MTKTKIKKDKYMKNLEKNPNITNINIDINESELEKEFFNQNNNPITSETIEIIQTNIISKEIKDNIKTTNLMIQEIEIDNFSEVQYNRAKQILEQNIKTKGVILYVWNKDFMSAKLLGITEINPVVHIRNTKELYLIENPIFIIDGKPIFMVVRGIPYTLEIILNVNKSQHFFFELKGYTSTEVHAKIKSIYTNVLYRQSPSLKFYLTMFLLMIIEALALHIVYANYYAEQLERAKKKSLIIPISNYLLNTLFTIF